MAENLSGSPLFAGRYRFQPVGNDWDRGRSGYTHLVFDIKKERLGVIKRAETKSQQTIIGLKNEVGALLDLKGSGVPEVYDTGEAEYGSKTYFYMIIEYIDGIRVEKNLASLTVSERAEILTQFFGLLTKAHQMGIVNGDIDLKHLFWRRDKKQLVLIDWGNSKLNVDQKKKTEFAYDLARSAEIIYSLVTFQGHPPLKGSLALPDDSKLVPGLAPLPIEFRNICKWAPRTPTESIPYHTATELFEVAKRWNEAVHAKKPYKAPPALTKRTSLVLPLILGIGLVTLLLFFAFFDGVRIVQSLFTTPTFASTETAHLATPDTPMAIETSSPTDAPTKTSTQPPASTSTITQTPRPSISPVPGTYRNAILVFDQNDSPESDCWDVETNLPLGLNRDEGFTTRVDGNWRFKIESGRTADQFIQIDFGKCLDGQQVDAIALNIWVPRLELERNLPDNPKVIDPGKEFGFFIEDENGQRREYTIWLDKNESMHLRVRDDNNITTDDVVLIVNKEILKIRGGFPRFYAEFPIQIFYEINNNGLDIIYLREGPVQEAVRTDELDPNQMIIIPGAERSTLGNIQKIGLIGYGGETQTVIWPLVFFEK